jgi:glycosyltransferase involved in cell wall biosynthesis
MASQDEDRGGRRVIYVTYDGLEEPLGKSQVRPYVEGLARRGHRFDVVSFEKRGVLLRIRQPIHDSIRWTARRYHKRPTTPATAFDLLSGTATIGRLGFQHGADLLHVRSYVAATMALPWTVARRVPLLFDMRGLWADEKVEGGAWPAEGPLYRMAKAAERVLLRRADVIAVLTRSMQEYLRTEYPHRSEIRASIHVIPTCTDLDRFSITTPPDPVLSASLRGKCVLGYVGSIGTWYMAEDMARFYLAWRGEIRRTHGMPARFLVISQSQPDPIRLVLEAAGLGGELIHHPVHHCEVPAAVRCLDAAICFRKPTFSARGGAPTKVGEALACGIPVAANVVGDLADVLAGTSAGVIVDDMSDEGFVDAARRLIVAAATDDVADEARSVAECWFDLDRGVDALDCIYRNVPAVHGSPSALHDTGWPA